MTERTRSASAAEERPANEAATAYAADQIRVAIHTGGDARAAFDALRLSDAATAQAVAHALAAGGVR